jgi:prophage regulatory protein
MSSSVRVQPASCFIDQKQVLQRTRMSRSYLYVEMKSGRFPRPVKLGRKNVWPESQIDSWICSKAEASRQKTASDLKRLPH